MKYAKENESKLQYPTQEEFAGIPNFMTNEPALRRRRYLPLVGEAEPREGYTATPSAWHIVEQSTTRREPRQVVVEDWEADPETGERRKIGEHAEMVDTEITVDTSYIQVDKWVYLPIPVPPPPEPEPVVYSKLQIVKRMVDAGIYDILWENLTKEQRLYWENSVNFKSDNPEFVAGLAMFKAAFPQIDADSLLAQCIAD